MSVLSAFKHIWIWKYFDENVIFLAFLTYFIALQQFAVIVCGYLIFGKHCCKYFLSWHTAGVIFQNRWEKMGIEFLLGIKYYLFWSCCSFAKYIAILELKTLGLKGISFPLITCLILEELEFDSKASVAF